MNNIRVIDRTDTARDVLVSVDSVAGLVAGWLTADGAGGEPSRNVLALVAALRRGDWTRVHALADFLSLDVDVEV